MAVLFINAVIFFMGKEAERMMAMLWAQQIMLGKPGYTYSKVPRLLKDKVREILIDSGMEELVNEEAGE